MIFSIFWPCFNSPFQSFFGSYCIYYIFIFNFTIKFSSLSTQSPWIKTMRIRETNNIQSIPFTNSPQHLRISTHPRFNSMHIFTFLFKTFFHIIITTLTPKYRKPRSHAMCWYNLYLFINFH